jgi:hypothetical protein
MLSYGRGTQPPRKALPISPSDLQWWGWIISRFYVVALASCLPLFVFNQTPGQEKSVELRHGTILLYELTAKQFIVVADSKLHADGKNQSSHDQLCCKIVNLADDTLFFYTGNIFEVLKRRLVRSYFLNKKLRSKPLSISKRQLDPSSV